MKNISINIEDKIYEEIQDVCKELNETIEDFVAAALSNHLEERMKLADSKKTDEILEKVQGEGEDEWI
ncbi:hypothetical protein [Ilyobacter polytropus]|jgi:metal-responsive CopG/Arc/MetJ family transcriptional regulator|uniref:CopG/DNA-binding domain-containing protein n=1 Tax=Ilyobacter polytropus (strain ATCC 51220 / DSM 2926 / LMG 16218 / CuHBu1) TaxID=572544 RepID=E3HAT1_ILYPC|nr:hypothetical protein [Ilyobacter polytropus]ADO82082.1 CopG/DNA-binding domain-containing protein [Ilyobacter polytropus DSM 2926]